MNEVIFFEVDRDNLCETNYFDDIVGFLNKKLSNYSIIITANWTNLPATKYKKIVILGGEEGGYAGLKPYSQYSDVIAVFRFYNIKGRYDNKYIFPIPPGYNCRSNDEIMIKMYPEKKISERKYDIFYSGQILNCRKELVVMLERLKDSFTIFSQVNPSFRRGLDINDYYRALGDTKICVCPDGASADTFRYVEACGSGCIIITTPKEDLWYYHNAPVFFIDDWSLLTKDYISNILNKDTEAIHYATLDYYQQCLSAEAVVNYIKNNIQKL